MGVPGDVVGVSKEIIRIRLARGPATPVVIEDRVEPRRDLRQLPVKLVGFEDEQRAQHPHPGRAALGRGADHNVPGAERETGPQGRVGERNVRYRFSPDTPHSLRVRSDGYVRWLRQDWSVRSKASRNMGQPVS